VPLLDGARVTIDYFQRAAEMTVPALQKTSVL
jgi:hypothetical protein